MNRSAILLGFAATACVPHLETGDAVIGCTADDECPLGHFCVEVIARCVADDSDDLDEPVLVGAAVLSPPRGRAGTRHSVTFTLNEPTALDPVVRLGNEVDAIRFDLDEAGTDRGEQLWAFAFRSTGTETEGEVSVVIEAVDRSGNVAVLTAGTITLDFTAPSITGLAWQRAASKTAAAAGDSLAIVGNVEGASAIYEARVVDEAGVAPALDVTSAFVLADGGVSGDVDLGAWPPTSVSFFNVEVVVVDDVGNQSLLSESRTPPIPFDPVAPTGPFIEILGPPLTAAQSVDVFVSASGASEVRLGGDILGNPAWVPSELPVAFTVELTSGAATKTVTAVFRDGAWNESAIALATVVFDPAADVSGPQLLSASATGPQTVDLLFSEPLDDTGTRDALNYAITPSLSVIAADHAPASALISLITAPHTVGETYTVTVSGIADLNGNPIDPSAASTTFLSSSADTTAPLLYDPGIGEAMVNPTGDVTFQWSPRQGAISYEVEVFSDAAATVLVMSESVTVPTLTTTLTPGAGYWWRVRADVTQPADAYSALGSFGILVDTVNVYCPVAVTCGDMGETGAVEQPFGTIARALAFIAVHPQIDWRIRVAARGDGGNYVESIAITPGTSLLGGYDASFDETFRDLAGNRTGISGSSPAVVQVLQADPVRPLLIEGVALYGPTSGLSIGLYVGNLTDTDALTVRDASFYGGDTSGESYGVYIVDSGSLSGGLLFERVTAAGGVTGATTTTGLAAYDSHVRLVASNVSSGFSTSGYSFGIETDGGSMTLDDCTVTAGDVDYAQTRGMETLGTDLTISNSVIRGGDTGSAGQSGGLSINTAWSTVVNSVIASGFSNTTVDVSALRILGVGMHTHAHNLIIAGGGGRSSSALQMSGGSTSFTNTLLVGDDGANCVAVWVSGFGGFSSIQNSAVVGCDTAHARYVGSSGDCAFSSAYDCYAITDLNDASLMTGGMAASASANVNVATTAAAAFVDSAAGDYHLTTGSPASLTTGGKATDQADCGTMLDRECGSILDDQDGNPRPGDDAFYSIGPYELDP